MHNLIDQFRRSRADFGAASTDQKAVLFGVVHELSGSHHNLVEHSAAADRIEKHRLGGSEYAGQHLVQRRQTRWYCVVFDIGTGMRVVRGQLLAEVGDPGYIEKCGFLFGAGVAVVRRAEKLHQAAYFCPVRGETT